MVASRVDQNSIQIPGHDNCILFKLSFINKLNMVLLIKIEPPGNGIFYFYSKLMVRVNQMIRLIQL